MNREIYISERFELKFQLSILSNNNSNQEKRFELEDKIENLDNLYKIGHFGFFWKRPLSTK